MLSQRNNGLYYGACFHLIVLLWEKSQGWRGHYHAASEQKSILLPPVPKLLRQLKLLLVWQGSIQVWLNLVSPQSRKQISFSLPL